MSFVLPDMASTVTILRIIIGNGGFPLQVPFTTTYNCMYSPNTKTTQNQYLFCVVFYHYILRPCFFFIRGL